MTRTWLAPAELDPAGRRAFGELVAYCLPGVDSYHVTAGPRPAVTYTATDDAQGARVASLLTRAYKRCAATRAHPPRVVLDQWDLPADAVGSGAVFTEVGPGLRVGGPSLARMMLALDSMFADLAEQAGALEHSVPAMVSWSTLDRAGYPANFPQHLTACAVVGPDLDALDRFAAAASARERTGALRVHAACLAPTVCLNVFAMLADRALGEEMLATASGTCARHEAGDHAEPTRLWAFRMREIIYVGDAAGAERFRDLMLEGLVELARKLALPARVMSATDPFFVADRGQLASYQGQFDVKTELVARMAGDGEAVAVSSVNLHQQHFGLGFGIRLADGSIASSACVGFGLERWALWLLGYFGDDPAGWPTQLRGR